MIELPDDLPILDQDAIDGLVEAIGLESLNEIVEVLRSTAPPLCARIAKAVTDRQSDALRSAAHQLKGSSANLGAVRLPALCLELERLGSAADFAAAAPLVDKVADEYRQLDAALALLK